MLSKILSPRWITHQNAITHRNNEITPRKHGQRKRKYSETECHPERKTQTKRITYWQTTQQPGRRRRRLWIRRSCRREESINWEKIRRETMKIDRIYQYFKLLYNVV